jgi:dihydroflavonol-4-reductase
VRVLTLPGEDTHSLSGLDVVYVPGDVLDTSSLWESFQGVKGVFHLAGIISIMPEENALVRHVNVEGTANVLKEAVRGGVERLFYTVLIPPITSQPTLHPLFAGSTAEQFNHQP